MMMSTQLGDPFSLEAALQHIAANPVSEFGDCAAEASVGQVPSDKGCTEAAASGHVDQAVAAAAGACLVQQQALQPAVVERSHPSDESEGAMEEVESGCVFCGVIGNDQLCGPLKPAVVNDVPVRVHHLCALWAPQVYQQEGCEQYINLEEEYRRAESRVCTSCGYTGAAISCTDPGCKCSYHLPCAITTPNVFLDVDAFELWCPVHADNDEEEDSGGYGSVLTSSRGRARATAATSRRQRGSLNDTQRSRTDWQKRDEHTWQKVVPPWWGEHKTVHFASKVYRELFRSAPSVIVVDASGTERLCTISPESRNDARQQYTLRGRFSEWWDVAGVQAGDTLSFRQEPATGRIHVQRYQGAAPPVVTEQASQLSQPAGTEVTSTRVKQEPVDLATRGVSQQGSHPNRWMELTDGWCIKTVYKSTIAHQQCPVAGWLFKKLFGRLPSESDKAVMTDPDLGQEYRFDVNFIGAANVHYITGRNFGAWMRESGLRASEQIRVKKDGNRVLIQRVPSDMRVHVDFSRANSRGGKVNATPPTSGGAAGTSAPPTGAKAAPPADDPMEALDSLAAAAGFAAVHGTPAIAAALAAPPAGAAAAAVAAAAAGMALRSSQQLHQTALPVLQQVQQQARDEMQPQQSAGGGDAAIALGKRRRMSTVNDSAVQPGAPNLWPVSSYPVHPSQLVPQQAPPQPFSPQDWSPRHPHMLMYKSLLEMVGRHEWSAEEQETVLKFRARFGRLGEVGREVTFFNVRQYQDDRAKLLTILAALAE